MKTFGRIFMFIVAGVFLTFSIINIIKDVQAIQALGIGIGEAFKRVFTGNFEAASPLWHFCWQILNVLIGLVALRVALKGSTNFLSFVAAMVMLGFLIADIVFKVQGSRFTAELWPETLRQLFMDFGMFIAFILGHFFVWVGNKSAD